MIIKILGPGCANCASLEKNTRAALVSVGMTADVEKVTDYPSILEYGVMKTPGLVIDEELVLSGKVANVRQIAGILSSRS